MRIVFLLASADLSGGARVVATYARLLARRGHQVTVVSTPPPALPLRRRVKSLLRGRGWPAPPRPGPTHVDHPEIAHHRLERFRPMVDSDLPDADVVVATWWLTAEWMGGLSPRKGAWAHFIQGHDVLTPGAPEERVLATWRLPAQRIVCSQWLLKLAREEFGDPTAVCIPNGVELDQFAAPPRGKQPQPTVGLVYSDMEIKGCDVALEAVARVARRLPGLRLKVFAGDPISARLPVEAQVWLRPDQARIPEIYAGCDVWLWPSRREGFGLPILEAMACGTPVVAAPAGAAPELLAAGGGVLLPAAEPEPMAHAIERICRLPDAEWRLLSGQARAVAERHGWDPSAGRFEAALESAVARRTGQVATAPAGASSRRR